MTGFAKAQAEHDRQMSRENYLKETRLEKIAALVDEKRMLYALCGCNYTDEEIKRVNDTAETQLDNDWDNSDKHIVELAFEEVDEEKEACADAAKNN